MLIHPSSSMKKAYKFISRLNFKTIIFNLKYFPFRTAIKLPVLLSRRVFVNQMKGRVIINAPIKTGMIQIGYGKVAITDFKRSRAIWEVAGDVVFNGSAYIMTGCKLMVFEGGTLIFGDEYKMSVDCSIVCQKKIQIGDNSGISWESLVMDTDFHHIYDENGTLFNHPKEIIIGDKVWVGCKCTILKGAVIPDGCIVAANSMVTKKLVEEKSVWGGNPLRVLKAGVSWHY